MLHIEPVDINSFQMHITVNGENKESEEGTSIQRLLKDLAIEKDRVAVELNSNIVPRQRLDQTILHENDKIEIVTFVGGG
ncbi:MAG: sulfur carrier protein ThiS [Candidatus Anammoxibacter sp.]